jgi:hypothetical protein
LAGYFRAMTGFLFLRTGRSRKATEMVAFLLCASVLFVSTPALAEGWWVLNGDDWRWADREREQIYSVAVMGGAGTERTFSETLTNLFDYDTSGDRVVAVAGRRKIAWFRDQLSIDAELYYAHHFGREVYEEFGAAGYLRWHAFPWSEHLPTSFAVGMGPSYTTIYPMLETQEDPNDRSKLLNQFNLELTLGLPNYPSAVLVTRLQHRSGVFGLSDGVTDASNFLMIGIEYRF